MIMSFLEWLLAPLTDATQELTDSITKVVKKDVELTTQEFLDGVESGKYKLLNKAGEVLPPSIHKKEKKSVFRPTTFKQYIGQASAKKILQNFIVGTRQRKLVFPHTLIHGSAGCGKTTLVKIVSNQLKVPIVETITSDISDFSQLKDYLHKAQGGILFLDEIHSLDRNNAEKMYSIMEDFSYNGLSIAPFTLMGATTELGEIIKNRKPFYDRFKIIVGLEDYTLPDLTKITEQYKRNVFSDEIFNHKNYHIIAKNSRDTPRTAIRLLEATIYFNGNVEEVLNSFGIILDGYTNTDLRLLDYMNNSSTAVGLQGIASYLSTSEANYIFSIEPYLLKNGIIVRTPRGRLLTEKGRQLLTTLRG
jgi:Holliday junction DNA helicase RuvB